MTGPATDPHRRPPLTLTQVIGLAVVLLTLVVIFDFNRRLQEAERLVAARDQEATAVGRLALERSALGTQVAYATTDAAVIEWAHASGRMVQPGEVLVAPIVPTFGPTPLPAPSAPQAPPPNWKLWWELFFGAAIAPQP